MVPDKPGHSPNLIEPCMCPRRITGCRLSSLQKERFKRHRDCWQLSAMPVKQGAGCALICVRPFTNLPALFQDTAS
jgi:hypothetical protein